MGTAPEKLMKSGFICKKGRLQASTPAGALVLLSRANQSRNQLICRRWYTVFQTHFDDRAVHPRDLG
jgi:hypothetical protein